MLVTRDVARSLRALIQIDNYQAFRDVGDGQFQCGLRVTEQADGSAILAHWPDVERTERVRWVLWRIGHSLVCHGFAVEFHYPQPGEVEFPTTLPERDFPINPVLIVRDIPRSFQCERCRRLGSVQEMGPRGMCQECEQTL